MAHFLAEPHIHFDEKVRTLVYIFLFSVDMCIIVSHFINGGDMVDGHIGVGLFSRLDSG